MEDILNRNIKEVLKEFPALEQILNEFNIGCISCSMGSCLLRDIVEIHNLADAQEIALMGRIGEVVFPGQGISLPRIQRKTKQRPNEVPLSPPLKELVDEHTVIKRLIALMPEILRTVDIASPTGRITINNSIDFIRNFADAFHHAKEENILFGYFDQGAEIIASFIQEHELGRSYVRAAVDGLSSNDTKKVGENLAAYGALLSEHIKKEDEILYPWMNRTLTDNQVGMLFSKFADVNREYRIFSVQSIAMVTVLENQYGHI